MGYLTVIAKDEIDLVIGSMDEVVLVLVSTYHVNLDVMAADEVKPEVQEALEF